MEDMPKNKWPKRRPVLTEREKWILTDRAEYWLTNAPKKYEYVERFNQIWVAENCRKGGRVLEIGAGLGEHLRYEDMNKIEFYALDIRPEMIKGIKKRFPKVKTILGDCQKRMDFPKNFFDRVLAIHVLEHLPNLPSALKEVHRVLKPDGEFGVVIPCEGGLARELARYMGVKQVFEKKYGVSYDWYNKIEHINTAKEIIEELDAYFDVHKKSFFPLRIPSINLNLALGMVLKPKNKK